MSKTKAKHFKLMRDDARPVEFDGVEIAAEEREQGNRTRAAVYQTVGGNYVAEYAKFDRRCVKSEIDDKGVYRPGEAVYEWEVSTAKVASFPTLEEAAEWFRPGAITTALLAQLQDQLKGEHIE